MSVTLIKADTFQKVEEVIFQTIKIRRDKHSPIVVIVPDQFTQTVEKSMFKALDIRCSFDIDVMSFARLAKHYKQDNKPELNQQTSVLLLSKIISTNSDKLTCYNKVAGRGRFANQMYAVMTAIRNNNILPDKLRKASNSLGGYLGNKINDIAIVLEGYLKELADNYTDISSLLDGFRESVGNIAEIKSTDFYIFGFHSMTPNKRAIVNALMQEAKSVTIGLVDIAAHDNAKIAPADIKALEGIAQQHKAKIHSFMSEHLSLEQQHCLNNLFGYNLPRFLADNSVYSITRTRNVEDEIKYVAQRIKQLIMQGYRYRDIAVVCEDFNKYSCLINKIFDIYKINYFIDSKTNMTDMPQYKFFEAVQRLLRSNCDRDYVMQMLKSGACDIDYASISQFENYVYKYNVDRMRFLAPFELGEQAELSVAEHVRLLLLKYISPLMAAYKGSAKDMISAVGIVICLLKDTPMARYIPDSNIVLQEVVNVAWTRLDATVQDIELMLGDSDIKGIDIFEHMLDCIASINFSIAPLTVDCVFIGTPQESRFESTKIMFLLGADGQGYPIVPSDNGIIRDADINVLGKFGIDMQPNHLERVRQSKFYISQLLVRAKEQVYISCPSLYGDIATIANQLKDMFKITVKEVNPNIVYGDSEEQIALKIGTYANLPSIFCRNYGRGEVGLEELTNFAYGHADNEIIKGLYESIVPTYYADSEKICFKENYLKISGLERFFDCPFAYYTDSALKLKERPMGKVEINELGSFVHRVLEIFYTDNGEPIDDADSLAELVKGVVVAVLKEDDFAHFTRQDNSHGYEKQLIARCVAIIAATNKMLLRSEYRPLHLEYQFGMGNGVPPIDLMVGGQIFKVRGVIDRVDSCGDQIIVIDYKSSDKDFDVKNVFSGHRLQLIVYLQALLDDKTSCMGLYYLGLPYKYAKDRDDGEGLSFNYNGFIIKNLNAILQQDNMAESQTFLPIKYKRGNKELDLSKENLLQTHEFDILQDYVAKLIEKAVITIKGGYITPAHTEGACKYCGYTQICKLKDKESMQLKDIVAVWEKTDESNVE